MNIAILKLTIYLIAGSLFINCDLYGQTCDNSFISRIYKGSTYEIFGRTVFNNNEIITAGKLYDYNGAGHIAKYTGNGVPIWSYQYHIGFYSFISSIFFKTVYFRDILATSDGGYLVSGCVDRELSPYGNPPPVKKYALLAKIDPFGNVAWNKTLSNRGDLSITTLYQTSDGDCIAYLCTDNGKKLLPGDHSYGKILRISPTGTIIWSTLLFTYLFDAGGLGVDHQQAITQTSNKNIVLGQVVHKTDPGNNFRVYEGNLHFLELDYATGRINWETSYEYPVPLSDPNFSPDLVRVDQLPDGRLSFLTSLYVSTPTRPNLTMRATNIITSATGKMEELITYYPGDGSPCFTRDATREKSGNRTMLINNQGKSILCQLDDKGAPLWNRGYTDDGNRFPVNCFSAGQKGYNLFGSNNADFHTRLLITDSLGYIDCANTPANMNAEQIPFNFPHDSVKTDITIQYDNYQDFAYPLLIKAAYPLSTSIECRQMINCCTDYIDSTNITPVRICEGSQYLLPGNTMVSDSGLYYVNFKTAAGCDSIRYYLVSNDKEVNQLSLGADTCLTGPGSIQLLATPGFNKYYWGTNSLPASNSYPIARPGTYWVTVANTCGTKTDSIHIYDQCDYPVYMPGAFTPNSDGLNDYYRLPPLNKNRLVLLRIYNRWGRLVFQTTRPEAGWDGRLKNEPLPADTFTYYLELEGFSGNRVVKKGTFLLIR